MIYESTLCNGEERRYGPRLLRADDVNVDPIDTRRRATPVDNDYYYYDIIKRDDNSLLTTQIDLNHSLFL